MLEIHSNGKINPRDKGGSWYNNIIIAIANNIMTLSYHVPYPREREPTTEYRPTPTLGSTSMFMLTYVATMEHAVKELCHDIRTRSLRRGCS
jgi:hypothetical protein